MTTQPKAAINCATMAEVRAGIDAVDEALVGLLAARAGYIDRAAAIKGPLQLPARIDWRVEEVVAKVRSRAAGHGLDADLAEALWRRLIDWSIAREERALASGPAGQETAIAGVTAMTTATTAAPKTVAGAQIIDGKAFAARVRAQVAEHVARLKAEHGLTPGLAVVLVGEDPASQVYVGAKGKQTVEVGMASFEHKLPATTSEAELLALIKKLNADPKVHGILVQLPLPQHMNSDLVINALDPAKDVDGFHISNVGLLGTGQKSMVPCTPLGCLMMLRDHHRSLAGMNAVVVGRSNIVGKPMAQLLLGDSCTVTIAHSKTRNLAEVCRGADILIAAVGRPEMVTGDFVKPGATVIDVGINRIERDGKTRLVGDAHFASCATVAGAITPVPGGVGPMTIACLLANTLTAACRANRLAEPKGLTA